MAARWKLENDSTIIQGAKDMKLFNESAATLRKYRILQSNRLGFNVYAKSLKMGKDLDPRTANKRLASALESAGVPVRYTSGDEEYERGGKRSELRRYSHCHARWFAIPQPCPPMFLRRRYSATDPEADCAVPLSSPDCCRKPKPSLDHLPKPEFSEGGQSRCWEQPA